MSIRGKMGSRTERQDSQLAFARRAALPLTFAGVARIRSSPELSSSFFSGAGFFCGRGESLRPYVRVRLVIFVLF